ncbi:hypothetical protein SLEP1_g58949, partial [Rubroshorea leprosula]
GFSCALLLGLRAERRLFLPMVSLWHRSSFIPSFFFPSLPPLDLLLSLVVVLLWKLQPKGPQGNGFLGFLEFTSVDFRRLRLELILSGSNLVNLIQTNSRSTSQSSKERDAISKASYGLCGKLDFQVGKGTLVSLMSFDSMGLKRIDKDGNMIESIWRLGVPWNSTPGFDRTQALGSLEPDEPSAEFIEPKRWVLGQK